jgi:hypothetical protein
MLSQIRQNQYENNMRNLLNAFIDPISGAVERDLMLAHWPVPTGVKVKGGMLQYRISGSVRRRESGPKLLTEFVDLETASDEQIESYAQEYGVLGLCDEHGLPEGHRAPLGKAIEHCSPGYSSAVSYWEKVDSWRYYASFFGAIFRLASAIYSGRACDAQDWARVGLDTETALKMPGGELGALAAMINALLAVAPLQPTAGILDGKIVVRLATSNDWSGLFGGLATQLLFAVSRIGGIQTCSSCGQIYRPTRAPATGRNRYCPKCGKRAAWRAASAKLYRKKLALSR